MRRRIWQIGLVAFSGMAWGQASSAAELTDQFLASTIFYKQYEIARQIVALHDASVLLRIAPLLADEDRHQRGNAALIFAGLGDPRGYEVIRAILDDRSPRPEGQIGGMRWSLPAQIREDRYYAVHLLGILKDPRAIAVLRQLWSDDDVNYKIPFALGEIGGAAGIEELVGALDHPRAEVRQYVIEALMTLKAVEALPKLRSMTGDTAQSHLGKAPSIGETAREAIAAIEAARN